MNYAIQNCPFCHGGARVETLKGETKETDRTYIGCINETCIGNHIVFGQNLDPEKVKNVVTLWSGKDQNDTQFRKKLDDHIKNQQEDGWAVVMVEI